MNFSRIRLMPGNGQLPISFQIKNGLKHAISSGDLRPNTQMPSVRELADQLSVAPNTVARAYKELQDDGLLLTYAGKGTYVADIITHSGIDADKWESLLDILRPAVAKARALGIAREQVVEGVNDLFFEHSLNVGLVGINKIVVEKWTRILEEEFSDLGIRITGITLDEAQADIERSMEAFANCYYVLSLITTYAETRSLFMDLGKKIVAIITEVSMATHQALASIPHRTPVALLCEDIYINNLLSLVAPYVDLDNLLHVPISDEQGVARLIESTKYILHTISLKQMAYSLATPDDTLIELEFLPNRSCFSEIRHMLTLTAQPA